MKTIVWDVDDVLNDLTYDWLNYWNKNTNCNIEYSQLSQNPPHNILQITFDQYIKSLDDFRLKYGMNLKPVKEIEDWFRYNGEKYRHIALTSTPLLSASDSGKWVIKHFGIWIRTFSFIPSYRKVVNIPNYDINKASFIDYLGKVDLFVDDNELNTKFVNQIGVYTINIPKPWNKSKITLSETLLKINKILE